MINAAGANLITQSSVEVLRPSFPIADQINEATGNASNNRNGMGWYSLAQKFANVVHALTCKNGARMGFSTQVYQSCSPLMFCVGGKTNPLQVFNSVVCLYSVNVVNRQTGFVPGAKRFCDHLMNVVMLALSIVKKSNFWVSAHIKMNGWKALFDSGNECLLLARSNPCVLRLPLRGFNPSESANKKRDAF